MEVLVRIVDGELHAKGFRSVEEGINSGELNLEKNIALNLGETINDMFDSIFGVKSTYVSPNSVYISKDGYLYAKGFSDVEPGMKNNEIKMDSKMNKIIGKEINSLFSSILGIESSAVSPDRVYIGEDGVIYAKRFIEKDFLDK